MKPQSTDAPAEQLSQSPLTPEAGSIDGAKTDHVLSLSRRVLPKRTGHVYLRRYFAFSRNHTRDREHRSARRTRWIRKTKMQTQVQEMAPKEMQSYDTRLASFQKPHQLNKRRASSNATKKKKAGAAEWPHEKPRPEEVSKAYRIFCSESALSTNAWIACKSRILFRAIGT